MELCLSSGKKEELGPLRPHLQGAVAVVDMTAPRRPP